jgi:predicted phosphoadenosine phosphosulfate sulfurtransferase
MKLAQVYVNENVLDAAKRRVSFIFDNFDDIKVSISGGKDSTVLAHLIMSEAHRRKRKVGMFFLDEEVIYKATVEQIEYLLNLYPENTIPLWLQIEYNTTNATSYSESCLVAWENGKHKLWMRPKNRVAIKFPQWDTDNQIVHKKEIGLSYYSVITNFEACYNNAAFFVGLRAVESMNRWRTMCSNPANVNGQNIYWATKKGENVSFYPIYDWNFSDVWRYIYDNKLEYNRVYDWQFRKGTGINEMRVSSLIHEKAFKSIVDLPEFEPDTYNRLTKRIKGIELAQETGKSAKLFRVRKLPKNFKTWGSYRDFLLETYPDSHKKEVFTKRFSKHLNNEYVARQQCRQLILADVENNLPVDNKPDPREALIKYYMEVL